MWKVVDAYIDMVNLLPILFVVRFYFKKVELLVIIIKNDIQTSKVYGQKNLVNRQNAKQ